MPPQPQIYFRFYSGISKGIPPEKHFCSNNYFYACQLIFTKLMRLPPSYSTLRFHSLEVLLYLKHRCLPGVMSFMKLMRLPPSYSTLRLHSLEVLLYLKHRCLPGVMSFMKLMRLPPSYSTLRLHSLEVLLYLKHWCLPGVILQCWCRKCNNLH